MPARLILTISAAVLAAAGFATLFAPEEIARAADASAAPAIAIIIQAAGSGLLAFAMLNWMSRGIRIGGIYGRPLGLANLLLFLTAALSLGKAASAGTIPTSGIILCALLAALAASFAWLVFAHDPLREQDAAPAQ